MSFNIPPQRKNKYAKIIFSVADGGQGGSGTTGSRQTRPINTIVQNDNIISLASNVITFAKGGKYYLKASFAFKNTGGTRIFFHNSTTVADLIISKTYRLVATSFSDNILLSGEFEVDAGDECLFQYHIETTATIAALGEDDKIAAGNEIFGEVEIWQL